MKILIAGGSGFLGKSLESYFSNNHHEVSILTRHPNAKNHILWDGHSIGNWLSALENADVLINLSGKSVDCRYTESNKRKILESRVDSTKVLHEALAKAKNPPGIWLNASSATIYVHAELKDNTETDGLIGDDFSMSVCRAWEAVFFTSSNVSIRKVALRAAIVLSNVGGAFPKLKLLSKIGLGGTQGKGTQYFSWIHIEDFCRAVDFIIENESIVGSVNLASPFPEPNATVMHCLAIHTQPFFSPRLPVFLLKAGAIFMRTESELILKSRRVIPAVLQQHGFHFHYPKFMDALDQLFKKEKSGG